MASITISRQLGSHSRAIALILKERLGYQLVYRELINQAALQAGAPQMALAVIDELGLLGMVPTAREHQAYRLALSKAMLSLADQGQAIIIGRAGQAILRERPDVLHVRVAAPLDLRAARTAEETHTSLECALAQVQASDRARAAYLRRYYHVRWDDQDLYDLVINTGRLTPACAADLICQALQSLSG
jgi:cytidylate kinase